MFKLHTDIPVHFIWIGKPLPEMIRKCFKTLCTVYKDSPIYLWTEASVWPNSNDFLTMTEYENLDLSKVKIMNVHRYDNHPIFKECKFRGESKRIIKSDCRLDIKADAYRLCILEEFGGVYLDADFWHIKDYTPELIKHDAALGQCDQFGNHGNGLIYVNRPKHPYITDIIEAVKNMSNMVFHRATYIGPVAAYKTRNAHKDDYEVYSVPYELFFVYAWEQMERYCYNSHVKGENTKIAIKGNEYAVHLWYDLLDVWHEGLGNEIVFDIGSE